MKGKLQTAILSALIILGASGLFPASASPATYPYTIIQVTDQVYINSTSYASLNDRGHLYWEEKVSDTSFKLGRYQAGGNVLIHHDTRPHDSFMVNNHDQVSWQRYYEGHYDIYLYRDGAAHKLTHGELDTTSRKWPQINDQGQVTWVEDFHDGDEQVAFYQGSGIGYFGRVTGRITSSARLNNQGHFVWTAHPDEGNEQVMFYDGSTTILADDSTDKSPPKINDQDEVVWYQGAPTELILYSQGAPTTIGTDVYRYFEINDLGQVAWISTISRLYLYSGGVNTEVDLAVRMPFAFNNRGAIAYQEYYYNSLRCYDPVTKTLVWVGSGPASHGGLEINEPGQISWGISEFFLGPDLAYLANPNRGKIVPPLELLLLD